MRSDLIIDLTDLESLCQTCAHCGTVVAIPLNAEEVGHIDHCPNCHRIFPEPAHSAVTVLVQAIRRAKESPHKLAFRVPKE